VLSISNVVMDDVLCCQTFGAPSFDDEEYDAGVERHSGGYETTSNMIADDDDVQFVDSPVEEAQVENITTLFTSCSPGRDTQEEEEDEDDLVPVSKFYGVRIKSYAVTNSF